MASADVRVTAGTVSERSVKFTVETGRDIMTWTMEQDQALKHAAAILYLAGISEMHINPNGDMTFAYMDGASVS